MIEPVRPSDEAGGGTLSLALLGVATTFFALVGGLGFPYGVGVAVAGVALSGIWRRVRYPRVGLRTILPALVAIAVLAVTAPPTPATELLAGTSGVAYLLWVADDPARPVGGSRRSMPAIALAALSVGLAWALALIARPVTSEVGVAGGLLALGILLLAVLLARPRPMAVPPPVFPETGGMAD